MARQSFWGRYRQIACLVWFLLDLLSPFSPHHLDPVANSSPLLTGFFSRAHSRRLITWFLPFSVNNPPPVQTPIRYFSCLRPTTSLPTMSSTVELTYQDVAEHNTKKDIYVVVHDKIYDCTQFVDEHPYVFTLPWSVETPFWISPVPSDQGLGYDVGRRSLHLRQIPPLTILTVS